MNELLLIKVDSRLLTFRQVGDVWGMIYTRASQNFRGYLPHSGLSSEWPGATLVGVSES